MRAAELFAAAIEARAIALMMQLDLSMPQLRTVLILRQRGRANGRQLAEALQVTPGAIVAICDHLEQRGYVRRLSDTTDRRITWFELTPDGASAFKPATKLPRRRVKAVIASLTPSEREGFIRTADAFAEALVAVFGAEAEGEEWTA